MSRIRYGGTSGGYKTIRQIGRSPLLGYTLEDLSQLVKSAGGVLYLDARKADGIQRGINTPLTNPIIDLANSVGKNLCPSFAVQNLAIDGGTGIDVVVANAQTTMPISVLPNTTYVMSGIPAYANRTVQRYRRVDGSLISVTSTATATFTTPSECATVERYYYNGASGLQSVIISIQLELGNTATAYEPYKKNNALLTNFAATQTDGYSLTLLPNGRTMPLLTFEGLDSLLILSNNPIIDITGTGDFEIAVGIFTPSVLQTGALYFDGNNGSVLADRKIAVVVNSDGSMTLTLEGTNITIATISSVQTNTYYDIRIKRLTGQLTNVINSVNKYDQSNTTNLASKSNKRIGALTTNVGGTTHGTYNKGGISHFIIAIGSDISKLDAVLNKVTADYR